MVDVGVEVGGGLLIELEIREDVEFEDCAICVEGAFGRAGLNDFSDSSRYFISITSASMMKLTTAGGTGCPFSRSLSCHALMKPKENIKSMKAEKEKSGMNRKRK